MASHSLVSFRCGHRAPAVILRARPDAFSSSRARPSDFIFRYAVIRCELLTRVFHDTLPAILVLTLVTLPLSRSLSTAPTPPREDQKPPIEPNENEGNNKDSTAESGVGVDRKAAGLKEALTVGGELMYECQAKVSLRPVLTNNILIHFPLCMPGPMLMTPVCIRSFSSACWPLRR